MCVRASVHVHVCMHERISYCMYGYVCVCVCVDAHYSCIAVFRDWVRVCQILVC